MKSTEKIFKQLKANPIAVEPLELGAMKALPKTFIYNVKDNKHIDTIKFTVEPLIGVHTEAKAGKVYNYYHNRKLKKAKANYINKILARWYKSDFLIIKGRGICLDDFDIANPEVITEKIDIFPSRIFFVGDESKTSVPLLIKEYHFEDEIFSEVIALRKAIGGGKRDAEEAEVDDYKRFRNGESTVYNEKINQGKILIWENPNEKSDKKPAQKAVSNAIIPSKFEFPKFEVGDFVKIKNFYKIRKELHGEGYISCINWESKSKDGWTYVIEFVFDEGEGRRQTQSSLKESEIEKTNTANCSKKLGQNYNFGYVIFKENEPKSAFDQKNNIGNIPKVYQVYNRDSDRPISERKKKKNLQLQRVIINEVSGLLTRDAVYLDIDLPYEKMVIIPPNLAKLLVETEQLYIKMQNQLKQLTQ